MQDSTAGAPPGAPAGVMKAGSTRALAVRCLARPRRTGVGGRMRQEGLA